MEQADGALYTTSWDTTAKGNALVETGPQDESGL
ncbi:MAG: hypothetical protein CNCCGFBP_00001 [Fimbriimonadaceae bacterium]|nr:hypothetical protein [Fimbriimonadaceae bacterium]